MKKITFILVISIITIFSANAQKQFKKEYYHVQMLEFKSEKVNDLKECEYTFFFNYKNTNNIKVVSKNHTGFMIFKKISKTFHDLTDNGIEYETSGYLSPEGNKLMICFSNNDNYGVRLIYKDYMLNYTN